MLLTIICLLTFGTFGVPYWFRYIQEKNEKKMRIAKSDLKKIKNRAVFFHNKKKKYPNNLLELRKNFPEINIKDPFSPWNNKYNYIKKDDYILIYSIGPDYSDDKGLIYLSECYSYNFFGKCLTKGDVVVKIHLY